MNELISIRYDLLKLIKITVCVTLVGALCACASTDREPEEPDSMPIAVNVSNSMSLHWQQVSRGYESTRGQVNSETTRGQVDSELTRSQESTRGSSDAEIPATIGVYGYNDGLDFGTVFSNQEMFHLPQNEGTLPFTPNPVWPGNNNEWVYNPVKYWYKTRNYKFYAYAPYDSDIAKTIALFHQSYNGIARFKRSKIPPISTVDYMVADRMVCGKAGEEPTFRLVHLTSRLRFCFAVGEEYDILRDIYVKRVRMSDVPSGQFKYYECEATLADDSGPLEMAKIEVRQSDEDYKWEGDGMIELTPEKKKVDDGRDGIKLPCVSESGYEEFSSAYINVSVIHNPVIEVVYDVYDKSGQLLRENQTVRNAIDISKMYFEGKEVQLERGKCYDVRLLVSPTYLYVLSDNDVKPDVIIDAE